jgi:hypothetical protein
LPNSFTTSVYFGTFAINSALEFRDFIWIYEQRIFGFWSHKISLKSLCWLFFSWLFIRFYKIFKAELDGFIGSSNSWRTTVRHLEIQGLVEVRPGVSPWGGKFYRKLIGNGDKMILNHVEARFSMVFLIQPILCLWAWEKSSKSVTAAMSICPRFRPQWDEAMDWWPPILATWEH